MSNMNTIISGNIMTLLRKNGKKQIDLAKHLGISKQVMSKMLGGTRMINAIELRAIASFFNVAMERLMILPDGMREINTVRAFMGRVESQEARKALEVTDELADMILFYARVCDNAKAMMTPWEA